MKVVVVVPSSDYRASAGARIRYGRLAEAMAANGGDLRLITIADYDPDTVACDALVISKCHDARSLIAAATASARAQLVGVDLFDDYFSQAGDSRLVAYRYWLRELLSLCDFCLCSTAALADVAKSYSPNTPTHLINDPSAAHDPAKAVRRAEMKIAETRQTKALEVAWFGVGDNPYFEVGINDLYGQSAALGRLRNRGYGARLTIVTNRRALSADGLEMINRLPLAYEIREWSEAVEAKVLDRSLAAFLPVARQGFSSAKSLNRALTALSHGCQVLSSGAPIYSVLDPLIYRDGDDLIGDLQGGNLRLSEAKLSTYLHRLRTWADAQSEATKLIDFLSGLPRPARGTEERIATIHGFATRGEVDQLLQKVGGLSVQSPFCRSRLQYDVRFVGLAPDMEMLPQGAPDGGPTGSQKFRNPATSSLTKEERRGSGPTFAYQIASYSTTMAQIERRLTEIYGQTRMFVSDTSRVPVSVSDA
jgi:hypothetical protein